MLGAQGDGTATVEKLCQLEVSGNSTSQNFNPTTRREGKVKGTVNQSLVCLCCTLFLV